MKSCRHAFLLSSLLLVASCFTSIVISTANAALINGSFESPIVGSDSYSTAVPTGWTVSFGGIVRGDPGPTFPVAHSGSQYSLNGTGGNWIQQTFTVGIGMGGDYELTWFDNTLINDTPTRYSVTVYDSANVAIASASSGIFTGAETWNARSLSMTLLEGGDYRLYFANDATATGQYYALDNVSLDATPVPEPPTIIAVALLLLPIGITILKTLRKTRTV